MKLKLTLPKVLRKKARSSTNSPRISSANPPCLSPSLHSQKSSAHLTSTASLDSNPHGLSLSSTCTSSSSSGEGSSSEGSCSKSLVHAQKVSSMEKEIVVLQDTTGKVESQFFSKLPSLDLRQELKDAFMRFDANHDGKISASELGDVLRSLRDDPSDEELVLMVNEADRDGDGYIDLEEFISLNASVSSAEKEDLHEAFRVFDADADGKISAEELHSVLSRLGESCTMEECSRMIRGVDTDGDGFVDFKEFCTMMAMQ